MIKYRDFLDNPRDAARALKDVANVFETECRNMGIPSTYQVFLFHRFVNPRLVKDKKADSDAIKEEVWGIKGSIGAMEEEFEMTGAPEEFHQTIIKKLLRSGKSSEELKEAARSLADKAIMIRIIAKNQGHHETVATAVADHSLFYNNPLQKWVGKLSHELDETYRKYVKPGGYVEGIKKSGLNDEGFLRLIEDSRGGDREATTRLMELMEPLILRKYPADIKQDARVTLIELIEQLPQKFFSNESIKEFVTYATYTLMMKGQQIKRKRRREWGTVTDLGEKDQDVRKLI